MKRQNNKVLVSLANMKPSRFTRAVCVGICFCALAFGASSVHAGNCKYTYVDTHVVPPKLGDKERKVLDELLKTLGDAAGVAAPPINNIKKGIDKLGPAGEEPNVTIVYECYDPTTGLYYYKTFNVTADDPSDEHLWAASTNRLSGAEAKDRDRMRANVIARNTPKDICCKATPSPSPSPSPSPTPTPTPTPSRPRTYTGPGQTPTPTPQEHGMAPKQPGKTGETCAVLISAGKITVETSGTGETIGHVADLKIHNLTDQPIKCAVSPVVLESKSRKNQDYVCPKPLTVSINPHGMTTVPVNGVCINRNKPPIAKGAPGDLVVNTGDPSVPQNSNSHIPVNQAGDLLRICTAKYNAADQLQKSGALKNLPYHDPQKQKDIVVQWSTWCDPRISQITGVPPATKDDLKKVVYKQLPNKPMSPETKKKVDQGIDTIFEKVELTTAKAKDLEEPAPQTPGVGETAAPSSGGLGVNAGSQPLPYLVPAGAYGTSWKAQKDLIETDEQFANWIDKVKKEMKRYRDSLGDSVQEKSQKDIVNRAIDQLDACKSIQDWHGETGLAAKKRCADDYLDPININSVAAKLWKDGFELYAYTIGLMLGWLQTGKVEVPWDLMNKALDFMIDGVQEVDKDKAKELKNVKELKDKVKDGKEKVETLKDALEKLKNLGEKK